MKAGSFRLCVVAILCSMCAPVFSQTDFFWSDKFLGEGAVNAPLNLNASIGEKRSLYLYYTTNGPIMNEMEYGFDATLKSSNKSVLRIDSVWIYNPEMVFTEEPENSVGLRWGFIPGDVLWNPWFSEFADGSAYMYVFAWSWGILEEHTGSGAYLDTGYDAEVDAFLCGRLDFTVLESGSAELINTQNRVLSESLPEGTFGPFQIEVNETEFELGDVNHDSQLDLLDVDPFIQLLTSGNYLLEADMNQDGTVNLLDRALFIDALVHAEN